MGRGPHGLWRLTGRDGADADAEEDGTDPPPPHILYLWDNQLEGVGITSCMTLSWGILDRGATLLWDNLRWDARL